ncbi:HSP20-like chaperone, partial [Amniculicola lignicola CBS 123094]
HAKRQQRKRLFRARFDVRENKEGYQVEGEVPGFEQENISIEVTDEYTLKVAGNTAQKAEQGQAPADVEAPRSASPAVSETKSHKSYQPTIEDDFEDLGADTSSTVSASEPQEPKGKERAHREWLSERIPGSFERNFQFPQRIDATNVRASLKNGVLSINVPKAPVPSVRQITIQ